MEFDGDFKINKTTEASLIILITLFFLLMGSIIAWVNYHSKSGREMLLDESLQLSFKGRVDSTFREEMNHNVECAVLSSGDTFELWPEW